MPRSLVVDMLGAAIGIDLSGLDDDAVAQARAAWADAIAEDGREPVATVAVDAGLDAVRALERLSQQVTLAGIEAHRGQMWMLHAAGIADADGRVLVFVGPSGRGKTTASIALGREFGYVSDETIGICADGAVRSYRKPLSIIEERGMPKVQRAPSSLGLMPLPGAPLTLAGIVLLDRREDGPEVPEVQPVSFVDAIEDIVPQSSSLVALERPLQFIAARIGETGGLRRITYREASALPATVRGLLSATAITVEVAPIVVADSTGARNDDQPHYAREAYVDAVAAEDSLVILQLAPGAGEGITRVLAGIAPTLWCAADGVPLEQLAGAVVEQHGYPPVGDAETLVLAAASEMMKNSVIRQV